VNSGLNNQLANPASIVLFFERLPADCDEKTAADIIYFNCGLNFDPTQLSCKTTKDGKLSTCLAVCSKENVAAFAKTILELYNSKLIVRAHIAGRSQTVAGRRVTR
jgi:hypothetical protein